MKHEIEGVRIGYSKEVIVLVIIKQNKCNDIHIQHIGIHDYFNAIYNI